VFLFRIGRFGRLGPLGMVFMAYRLWRRLSPRQKEALRGHARNLVTQVRQARAPRAASTPSTMARVGSATAPEEEIPR
jgi:hypothetical protein